MVNYLGMVLWTLGILFIAISFYFLNSIILKNDKHNQKIYFYLAIFFILVFVIFRTYLVFYAENLNNSELSDDVVIEKILFIRMFLHIPFVIAVTLFLVFCYSCLQDLKYKSK